MFVFVEGGDDVAKSRLVDHLTDPKNHYCVRGVCLKDAMVINPARLLVNENHMNQALDTMLSQIRIWMRSSSEVLIIDNLNINQQFKDRILYLAKDLENAYKDLADVFMVRIRIADPSMAGRDKPAVTVFDKNKFKFLIDVPKLSDNLDQMCEEILKVYTEFSERYIQNSFQDAERDWENG